MILSADEALPAWGQVMAAAEHVLPEGVDCTRTLVQECTVPTLKLPNGAGVTPLDPSVVRTSFPIDVTTDVERYRHVEPNSHRKQ